MKWFVLVAWVFLCLSSLLEATQETLRVVTWNLQWFPGGKPGADKETQDKHILVIREEIRKMNPDVILLQEVGSLSALEETLAPLGVGWKVAVISNFKQGGFGSGQQLAIASKLTADSAWAEPWQKGWAGSPRGYAYASFLIGEKRLGFYCLHLKSNLGDPAGNTSKREDATEQLLDHVASKDDRLLPTDAILIGGDFNTDDPDDPSAVRPGERSFQLLRKHEFSWGFEGLAKADRITCPAKGSYPDACFDHIWTKGLGKPLASVRHSEGSDHRPVMVEIAVP